MPKFARGHGSGPSVRQSGAAATTLSDYVCIPKLLARLRALSEGWVGGSGDFAAGRQRDSFPIAPWPPEDVSPRDTTSWTRVRGNAYALVRTRATLRTTRSRAVAFVLLAKLRFTGSMCACGGLKVSPHPGGMRAVHPHWSAVPFPRKPRCMTLSSHHDGVYPAVDRGACRRNARGRDWLLHQHFHYLQESGMVRILAAVFHSRTAALRSISAKILSSSLAVFDATCPWIDGAAKWQRCN